MPKVIRPGKGTTTTTTTPAPRPPAEKFILGAPTGKIPTTLKIAYGRGGDWATVNAHDPFFIRRGQQYGVDPRWLKSMEVVESGGLMIPNGNGYPNRGNMQLTYSKPGQPKTKWERVGERLGVDFDSPDGQIAIAAYVLGGHDGDRGTVEDIFLGHYYPVRDATGKLCRTCKGPDGHTPQQYLDDIAALTRIIDAAARGTTPAEPEPERPHGNVIDLLFGGKPYTIGAEYGQVITWQCPNGVNPGQPGNCYEFQKAYGLDDRHHYAIDCSADAGDGAPLYAPFDGTVVCAGTDRGPGAWGTGCGFNDRLGNYGGALPERDGNGRLEILNEAGTASLIIGHVLGSRVRAGDRVKTGDHIGWQGGMNASHVHAEGRTKDGRIGNPMTLFPGGPMPVTYAERIPMPQPSEWDAGPTVTVTRDGVPLLQRANKTAQPVDSPFAAGDTFEAVQLAYSEAEDDWYWITRRGTRIPIQGTRSDLLGER